MHKEDLLEGLPEELPELIASESLIDDFISVRKDTLAYKKVAAYPYFVVSAAKYSVAIIATSKTGEILITHEYRHPVQKTLLGCPGGFLDANEEPLVAAERELLEETGCHAEEYTLIGSCFPLPGTFDQKMYIVHAKDTKKVTKAALEPTEIVQCQFIEKQTLFAMMHKHPIDGIFCSALFFWMQSTK